MGQQKERHWDLMTVLLRDQQRVRHLVWMMELELDHS